MTVFKDEMPRRGKMIRPFELRKVSGIWNLRRWELKTGWSLHIWIFILSCPLLRFKGKTILLSHLYTRWKVFYLDKLDERSFRLWDSNMRTCGVDILNKKMWKLFDTIWHELFPHTALVARYVDSNWTASKR